MTYHVPFQTSLLGAQLRIYCWHVCRCADHLNTALRPNAAAWENFRLKFLRRVEEESDSVGSSGEEEESMGSTQNLNSATLAEQCGHHCTSNRACAANYIRDKVCSCQVSRSSWAKVMTLDRVFSGATCMLVASAVDKSPKAGLNRRGKDAPRETLPCVCNASYISFACCGTEGLVFEDRRSRLGRLAMDEV